MAKAETGTADFTSTVTVMTAFTLTGGADAAVVNLREDTVGGTIRYVVKAAINTTEHLTFGDGVTPATKGVWFVDLVSGTTPQMTITGS